MNTFLPAFIGIPGGPELLVILLLAVLLFGADKLPGLARSTGEAIGEFKKGREQLEDEIRTAADRREPDVDEETVESA
jgi:sec-independent protein translocase protein TatA